MRWTEIEVETASEAVEATSNTMMEAGASGVAVEDALDIENFESGLYGEILDKKQFTHIEEGVIVMAYFPETAFLPGVLPFIKENILRLPKYGLSIDKNEMTVSEIAESDWATAWEKYYHPARITRSLTVVSSQEIYYAQDKAEKVITLDPGIAFGTGTHPTTRLTLQALETVLRGGETVLDVGTGSGVLSIASYYLGTRDVYAYDLDEVAVAAAKKDMDLNPIAADVHVSANDLLEGIDHSADVIVANTLADIIVLMAEDAWRLLKQDDTFTISGIIEDKKAIVLEALTKVGFVVDQLFNQGDWYTTILKKPEEEQNATVFHERRLSRKRFV